MRRNRPDYVTRMLDRAYREAPGVVQDDLASALDRDRSAISHQLSGRHTLSADELDVWCDVLDTVEPRLPFRLWLGRFDRAAAGGHRLGGRGHLGADAPCDVVRSVSCAAGWAPPLRLALAPPPELIEAPRHDAEQARPGDPGENVQRLRDAVPVARRRGDASRASQGEEKEHENHANLRRGGLASVVASGRRGNRLREDVDLVAFVIACGGVVWALAVVIGATVSPC